MLKRRWLTIHWGCLIAVIILIFLTITGIITNTLFNPNLDTVSLEMIDEAAQEVILYFLILPLFTIIYWFKKRAWVFFPWQHNKAQK
jgi:hypothetical protein